MTDKEIEKQRYSEEVRAVIALYRSDRFEAEAFLRYLSKYRGDELAERARKDAKNVLRSQRDSHGKTRFDD